VRICELSSTVLPSEASSRIKVRNSMRARDPGWLQARRARAAADRG
jgi:hypothetical protein